MSFEESELNKGLLVEINKMFTTLMKHLENKIN